MADFEDANCPTWHNMIDGQINLRDAVRRTISLEQNGKQYRLKEKTAVLLPRPRGWHLDEKHATSTAKPVSAACSTSGLFVFHNAKELLARGSGPYFYLPKMESHLEARLWNDVFVFSRKRWQFQGSIKATALIETVLAAFEMDRDPPRAARALGRTQHRPLGLYFFLHQEIPRQRAVLLADRSQVTMTRRSCAPTRCLLVKTCHRRAPPAMGGMAAQIRSRTTRRRTRPALEKVRQGQACAR